MGEEVKVLRIVFEEKERTVGVAAAAMASLFVFVLCVGVWCGE